MAHFEKMNIQFRAENHYGLGIHFHLALLLQVTLLDRSPEPLRPVQ